jgi:hypothetical protein
MSDSETHPGVVTIETQHDYAHGLARCSCGRIGLNHYPWEPSTRYSR